MVRINGKGVDAAGMTITEYLAEADYDERVVVVERNEEIVSKEQYDESVLQEEDVVEIVSFMGGGC